MCIYLYWDDHQRRTNSDCDEHSRRFPGGYELAIADSGEGDHYKPERVGDRELLVLVVGPLEVVDAKHTAAGGKQTNSLVNSSIKPCKAPRIE